MIDISAQQAVRRRAGTEKQGFASIVTTSEAWLASSANNVRLDGDTIPHDEIGDSRVDGDDHTCRFVTQNVRACNLPGPNAAVLPEMNIGTDDFKSQPSWYLEQREV